MKKRNDWLLAALVIVSTTLGGSGVGMFAQAGPTYPYSLSAKSTDAIYTSPLIGNGEIVTTLGPSGYHSGYCVPHDAVNRVFFWAARRLKDARSSKVKIPRVPPEELIGPTIPLIRFGRLNRTLRINGVQAADKNWKQTLDLDHAKVISELEHGGIVETTESMVLLAQNIAVFHTRFKNQGAKESRLQFQLAYRFGDADGLVPEGARLHIRRPHPDDLAFGNVEGIRFKGDLSKRPPHLRESLSVQYEIENHLGEVRIGRYPLGVIRQTTQGGDFIHDTNLAPGAESELWFWVMFSDRLKYAHFPSFEDLQPLLQRHLSGWEQFWSVSQVRFHEEPLDTIRRVSLYALRCSTSPSYLPAGYLSSLWEGRTLHDEYFTFMGLISSNYVELASRIPNYRLRTLPHAEWRSQGHGTNYAWEATETGEESAPYGHWVDEQYRDGQFAEACWRLYLHTGQREILKRFYPVIRGCAEWLAYDSLERDEQGRLKVRMITDINEEVLDAKNPVYTGAAIYRTLQTAARAAEILGVDDALRPEWMKLAEELRPNFPKEEDGQIYAYCENVKTRPDSANLGMVYPFSFEVNSPIARRTFDAAFQSYRAGGKETPDIVWSNTWMWYLSRLATLSFYQNRGDTGWEVLQTVPRTVGPFLAPNEHFNKEDGVFLPWYTSGAGSFIYSTNAMFVQVYDEEDPILFPAVAKGLRQAEFTNLLASNGVIVSGRVQAGVPVECSAAAPRDMQWEFRLPAEVAATLPLKQQGMTVQASSDGLVRVEASLKKGVNRLW
jgi:hypothetical protein